MIQFLVGTDWVFTCVVYKKTWNYYLLQLFTYWSIVQFSIVFLGQATFRFDYTPIFPTLQLGNSSGPLWLHSSVLPTSQRENSWIGGFMFALTHSPHPTTRNTSVDLWLHTHSPDCTTRKLVGQLMISCTLWLALLVRTVRRKIVGALWSPACATRETGQALHVNAHFDGNSSALYRVISRLCNSESRRAFDDSRPCDSRKLTGVLWWQIWSGLPTIKLVYRLLYYSETLCGLGTAVDLPTLGLGSSSGFDYCNLLWPYGSEKIVMAQSLWSLFWTHTCSPDYMTCFPQLSGSFPSEPLFFRRYNSEIIAKLIFRLYYSDKPDLLLSKL